MADLYEMQVYEKLRARDRRLAILTEVQHRQKVNVTELSQWFRVSEVIIRRDLDHLDNLGLLRRIHGGARAISKAAWASVFEARLMQNVMVKQTLGATAAQLIKPGETVLLDAGTTILEVARHIPRFIMDNSELTVATRSLVIASELRSLNKIRLIVLGGIYDRDYDDFFGTQVENTLVGMHFDTLFIGVDGVTAERGVSTNHLLEAGLYRIMAQIANRVVVVTDSSKIDVSTLQVVLTFDDIHTFVTDNKAPEPFIQKLRERGVEVILVPYP